MEEIQVTRSSSCQLFIVKLSLFLLVLFSRTQKTNVVTQETKQSVVQIPLPVRGRLQRPRPNVQKARPRQIIEKGELEGSTKNEGSELQKDGTKSLTRVRIDP